VIQEADKKLIDLHQEVYLAFYDLTGVTVGVVLFVNMLLENALFLTVTGQDFVFGFFSFFLTIAYYASHMLQIQEKIKMFNDGAINWENSYVTRVSWIFITLFLFGFPALITGDWKPLFMFGPYVLAMYLPAVKIRERNKDRFKIVKWVMA
jgi:hypothetical protein